MVGSDNLGVPLIHLNAMGDVSGAQWLTVDSKKIIISKIRYANEGAVIVQGNIRDIDDPMDEGMAFIAKIADGQAVWTKTFDVGFDVAPNNFHDLVIFPDGGLAF